MKLHGTITEVADNADRLLVKALMSSCTDPNWAVSGMVSIQIPLTKTSMKTYHVGREITLTLEAK